MTPEQFCYWLQGYLELTENPIWITPDKAAKIQHHLNLVFYHLDEIGKDPEKDKILGDIHSGKSNNTTQGLPGGSTSVLRC